MFMFALVLTLAPTAGGDSRALISFWYSPDNEPDFDTLPGEFGTEKLAECGLGLSFINAGISMLPQVLVLLRLVGFLDCCS